MAVVRCNKEHYYDDAKYKSCPHCEDEQKTVAINNHGDSSGGSEKHEPRPTPKRRHRNSGDEKTENHWGNRCTKEDEDTIELYPVPNETRLLAGWLVEVTGPSKGRDHRLYYGWNRIGTAKGMDIVISDGKKDSEAMQAAIAFDKRSEKTYLVNGEKSLTYLNDRPLSKSEELAEGDVIKIGEQQFIFIPFCKGGRTWENL